MSVTSVCIPIRMLLIVPALCAGAAVLPGCHHDANADADKPKHLDAPPRPVELSWKDQPLSGVAAGVAAPVPVKEGPAPMVYLTERQQVVQVIDRTANKMLGQTTVPARSVVRVDERLGVIAGKQ